MRWFIVLVLILALAGCAGDCQTKQCLLEQARNGGTATFTEDLEGTQVRYSVKSYTLTKSVLETGPKEPPFVAELVSGKRMECTYSAIAFDEELFTLAGRLDLCTGPLKEALLEIRLAQDQVLRG